MCQSYANSSLSMQHSVSVDILYIKQLISLICALNVDYGQQTGISKFS